jgi:hypothetical protein
MMVKNATAYAQTLPDTGRSTHDGGYDALLMQYGCPNPAQGRPMIGRAGDDAAATRPARSCRT